jgi:oligoendopeptidase F
VLPRYAMGPSYFTESFGVFAELMTLRHLYRTERDTARKIFYLERLLDQSADLFRNSAEAAVEQAIYDSVAAGQHLGADAIEALMQTTTSKYSSWFGPNSERELAWMQPIQFYTWPLYRVNYVYARILALAYIDLLETEPRIFAPRFNELLSAGYAAPPDAILQQNIGLSLKDPAIVQRAVALFARWTGELRTLYGA